MLPQVDRPGTIEKLVTAVQAVLKFLRPFDQPDPWHLVSTYQSTWIDATPVKFRVDPLGRVFLRGAAARSGGALTPVFVLPVAYRPLTTRSFHCSITGGTSALVQVQADGVVVYGGGAGAVTVALDSISFDTDE